MTKAEVLVKVSTVRHLLYEAGEANTEEARKQFLLEAKLALFITTTNLEEDLKKEERANVGSGTAEAGSTE